MQYLVSTVKILFNSVRESSNKAVSKEDTETRLKNNDAVRLLREVRETG